MIHQYDVVIVGGGIAGLCTALTVAQGSCRVAVISKVHVTPRILLQRKVE